MLLDHLHLILLRKLYHYHDHDINLVRILVRVCFMCNIRMEFIPFSLLVWYHPFYFVGVMRHQFTSITDGSVVLLLTV